MLEVITAAGGNMGSVFRFLKRLDIKYLCLGSSSELSGENPILVPGVGSFGSVMENLTIAGYPEALKSAAKKGVPILGICSGMQVLFDSSEESPGTEGLGLIPGTVRKFTTGKIPHTGWSRLEESNEYVYFVNSYHCEPDNPRNVSDSARHCGNPFTAMVNKRSITGFQFHPEKSYRAGEEIMRRWLYAL